MTVHSLRRKVTVVATTMAMALALLITGGAELSASGAPGRCLQFFVAPDGDDSARGTKSDPWRTIRHARDHIRKHGLNDPHRMRCDITVNVRAGDYVVHDTITFGSQDSGRNGHQVVYRSYDGPGAARILGAEKVTGWEQYKGQIMRAPVDIDEPFYTLYEDGKRATTARTPNRRTDQEWAPYLRSVLLEPEKQGSHVWLGFDKGDWNPDWDLGQGTDWPARVTVWSGGSWSWFTDIVPIQNVNWDARQVTLQYWTRYSLVNSDGGSRYFIENSLDFLDEAGEYYLDYEEGMLYYWPRGDIDTATIWAPTVKTVVSLKGASANDRVHDVTFSGFALQYSDFVGWYRNGWISAGDSGEVHEYPAYDRQIEMPRNRFGAIRLTNTRDIELTRMHISDTGFTGVYLLFANDHVTVSDSLLENLGADGIKVEGGYPGEGDLAHDNTFTNNYIHHVGELVPGDAAGVELMNSGDNLVSHSVIEHSPRYGVSLEVRPEVVDGDGYAYGNEFSYLRIDDAGLDSGDMGAFYTYGVDNQEPHKIKNHVSQMVIGDVIPDASMPDSGTRGVHMDAGGCGFEFANVEVAGEVTDQKYQSYDCNEVHNANWQDTFDASQMEYDKIGLTDDFPYAVPNLDVAVQVPDLVAGEQRTVTVTTTNTGPGPAKATSLTLKAPAGWSVDSPTTKDLGKVTSEEKVTSTWQVTPPASDEPLREEAVTVLAHYSYGPRAEPGASLGREFVYVQNPVQPPLQTFSATQPAYFGQSGDRLAIVSQGADVWASNDEYGAIYRADAASAQSTSVVKVRYQEETHPWARAGLMVRNDMTQPGTSTGYAMVAITPGFGVTFQWDSDGNGTIDSQQIKETGQAPVWLKLVRDGNTFIGYYSEDKSSWTKVGSAVVPGVQAEEDVGVFMSSHLAGTLGTAEFSGFEVTSG